MIEGNVMVRLSVWLLLVWGLFGRSAVAIAPGDQGDEVGE